MEDRERLGCAWGREVRVDMVLVLWRVGLYETV